MADLFENAEIMKLDEVSSTNSYMTNLQVALPEGSIVLARFQTHGRGQGNNAWESEPGMNLTFSILLKPHFVKATGQFYISKVISLAVADLLSLFADNVFIKWPNDIYVGNKKIAGILIENAIEGLYISQSIVGVGINLNQREFKSLAPNPVSLAQLTNQDYDVDDILDTLKDIIEYRYKMLKNKEYKTIDENYISVFYQYGQSASYKSGGEVFNGVITGIEPTGELIIQDDSSTIRKFSYKEVAFL